MPEPRPRLQSPNDIMDALDTQKKKLRRLETRVATGYAFIGEANDNTTTATTTATFVKDTAVGDLQFEVSDASVYYRLKYVARAQSSVANDDIDIRILDGGASSPTAASTTIVAGSQPVSGAAGAGAENLNVEAAILLSVGTHTIAAFYGRAAGTGNVNVSNSTGGIRQLSIERLG